jgi:hypothetical protein
MRPEEDAASTYIVSLWGKNRREFARRYWAYLAYGMQEPPAVMCFGADRIACKLRAIGGENEQLNRAITEIIKRERKRVRDA